MSVQYSEFKTQTQAGITVHHAFVYHDDPASTRLMVMLPGQKYSCDYPVLYYVRRMAIQRGFDVLSVEYGFQAAHGDLDAETTSSLSHEVSQAVTPALQRGYAQVCIVGKSLGTPLAAELARTLPDKKLSLILLTPIGGAFEGVQGIPTLAMIGTSDWFYSAEMVASFSGVQWRVFDGLNHSLENNADWQASIAALGEVIAVCEEFIFDKE